MLSFSFKPIHSVLLLLLISSAAITNAQSTYADIDTLVSSFMAKEKIPGFAACVVKNGISWSKSYGNADLEESKPMSIDGIMNIGSISKTFTATCIMQLWERKLIDLHADVSKYLGFSLRNQKFLNTPITVFQLLTHTSSVIDGKSYNESYDAGDPTISLQLWIEDNFKAQGKFYYAGSNFADWSPGTTRKYSNMAFGILGLIVEKVSKQPFSEYCRQNIFLPLGMKHTGWYIREIDSSNYIRPYTYITDENRKFFVDFTRLFVDTTILVGSFARHRLYSFPNYPDGLVRTSVRELSFFCSAIMTDGKLNGHQILRKATIDTMFSLQLKDDAKQGLTWHKVTLDGVSPGTPIWGHDGSDPGITTNLVFDRKNKIGIITFQNMASGGSLAVVSRLYQIAAGLNPSRQSTE